MESKGPMVGVMWRFQAFPHEKHRVWVYVTHVSFSAAYLSKQGDLHKVLAHALGASNASLSQISKQALNPMRM
eukprot:128636-Pelagomonas_calceolata.AAC.1